MFLLYASMRLLFQNGGGACYVVSVGSYTDAPISSNALMGGIATLEKEQEPTMVVVPDAMHLDKESDCISVQQQMLQHCKEVTKSRVAILDVYNGYRDRKDPAGDPVLAFRNDLDIEGLDYAAAYYPWLETTIFTDTDVTYEWVDAADLTAMLNAESGVPAHVDPAAIAEIQNPTAKFTPMLLNKKLIALSSIFPILIAEIQRQLNLLPPSAAMAGVYAATDNAYGVSTQGLRMKDSCQDLAHVFVVPACAFASSS